MKFKKFFILNIFLLLVLVTLNFFAFQNFWYWRWPWFDQPMHFVGGLVLGLAAIQLFLYLFRRRAREISGWDIALVAVASALLVGGLWEWFEFTADRQLVARVELKTLNMVYDGWAGSLKDLIFDLAGGVTAASLFLMALLWQKHRAQ